LEKPPPVRNCCIRRCSCIIILVFFISWLQPIKTSTGFLEEAFVALEAKTIDPNFKMCALLLDGMHIKMHLDYEHHKDEVMGFVDLDDGELLEEELAREAMVFMAVGLTEQWKMPLGYFFVAGLSAAVLSRMISAAIVRLHAIGIRALSVTLDGSAVNISAMKCLGCPLTQHLQHSFPHPSEPSIPVYVYWDPCHMLKLLRNMLGDWKVLYTRFGQVRWQHIINLHNFQLQEGVTAANKLSDRHIHYQRQKMKVSKMSKMFIFLRNFTISNVALSPCF
jgi:hypothetical protein